MTAAKSLQLRCAAANLESDQKGLWLNCHFLIKSCYQIYLNQILEMYTCAGLIIYKSNFILLNISYQNEHLECGQNGATTAIPTALRPLVSYLLVDVVLNVVVVSAAGQPSHSIAIIVCSNESTFLAKSTIAYCIHNIRVSVAYVQRQSPNCHRC